MADEYKARITTEADVSGAKSAETALDKVGEAAKKSAQALEDTSEQQEKSAQSGKELSKSIQDVSGGALQTQKLFGGFAKILSGNVLSGLKDATEAVRGLNVAMLANPAGKLVAGMSLLAGAWGVVSAAIKGSGTAAKNAASSSDELKDGMEGAAAAAQKLSEETSAYEKLAAATREAADQLERYRKIQDELTDASVAQDLANTDLAEASGQISPDEARAKRAGIRVEGQRAKSQTAIATADAEIEQARRQVEAQNAAAAEAAGAEDRAKADLARRTQEGLKTGAPLELGSADNFAAPKAEAQRRLEQARNTIPDAESGVTHQEMIDQAQAQVDAVDDVAAAHQRAQEMAQKAAEAEKARAQVTAEASKKIAESTQRRAIEEIKAQTAEKAATTEQLKHVQDVNKAKEAEKAKFIAEAPEAVANAQELSRLTPDQAEANAFTPEERANQKQREKLEEEAATTTKEIAKDASGLKGPSPEVTERISQAADALGDGASQGEIEQLNGVLEKLATSLEKRGKDAEKIRELQGKLNRLEGIVNRLESEQGR